jgi:hypothetical protein
MANLIRIFLSNFPSDCKKIVFQTLENTQVVTVFLLGYSGTQGFLSVYLSYISTLKKEVLNPSET